MVLFSQMAKVVAPLLSLSASGPIGGVFSYVCGLYAKRATQSEKFEYTTRRISQETKFSEGAGTWSSLGEGKKLWSDFALLVSKSEYCPANYAFYMTGYQTFMSFYLDKGADGWPNYPLPPD